MVAHQHVHFGAPPPLTYPSTYIPKLHVRHRACVAEGVHGMGACVVDGVCACRRGSHLSRRYASYWIAFLFTDGSSPDPPPLTLIIGILSVRATHPLNVTHNVCENPTESSHVGT